MALKRKVICFSRAKAQIVLLQKLPRAERFLPRLHCHRQRQILQNLDQSRHIYLLQQNLKWFLQSWCGWPQLPISWRELTYPFHL